MGGLNKDGKKERDNITKSLDFQEDEKKERDDITKSLDFQEDEKNESKELLDSQEKKFKEELVNWFKSSFKPTYNEFATYMGQHLLGKNYNEKKHIVERLLNNEKVKQAAVGVNAKIRRYLQEEIQCHLPD